MMADQQSHESVTLEPGGTGYVSDLIRSNHSLQALESILNRLSRGFRLVEDKQTAVCCELQPRPSQRGRNGDGIQRQSLNWTVLETSLQGVRVKVCTKTLHLIARPTSRAGRILEGHRRFQTLCGGYSLQARVEIVEL
ncbi:hypothetical protein EVAR_40062_1 [Eumeta japonica]|uniref:Uncharacterized protein n=1 Tax=Eumeta variegata TaxID=151549 RepID=A0A4C1W8G1_EUMVA|nr:hypothetical protein EVAR_40062_1 [Eumeta japonica]